MFLKWRSSTTAAFNEVTTSTPLPVSVESGGGDLVPKGYQQISAASLASAVGFTIPSGATKAVVHPESAAVRWRDDGTDPTASIGMNIAADQYFTFSGATALAATKFILVSGSPKLNVSYYG